MKKLFAVLLAVCMVAALAACGGQTPSSSTPAAPPAASSSAPAAASSSEPAEPAEPVNLVWAGWSGEEAATKPVIEGMISSWNDANPNATVSWVGWPWADTLPQLIIRNDGNEALDVAQLDSSMFPALVEADALVDLNTVFEDGWLADNIPASALEFGQADGVQYGLPWTTASIGMLYNPTLLASVGYTEPPATMEDFEACLQALRDADPDIIPYAVSTMDATATADFMPWLWAFGGNVFDEAGNLTINSPEAIETLTWYKDMMDKGFIRSAMSRFDARQLFAQGRIAFFDDAIMANGIMVTNGVAEEDLEATIQPMLRPVLNSGDAPTSTMWGHMLVILKKSENQQQAVEFMKHVISPEQSLTYFETSGMLPVMNEALADPSVTSDPWAAQWSEITATGRDNELKNYPQNAELSTIISEELQAVIVGDKTPQQAAESMETRIQAAL